MTAICSLQAFEVPVELRRPVRHARFTRHCNDTLLIRCELRGGEVGWGEGLPRAYVTGESMETVWRQLAASDFFPLAETTLTDPADCVPALDALVLADVPGEPGVPTRECLGNSIRSAVELAVLDAACRAAGCSLSQFLMSLSEFADLCAAQPRVRYSGVVTADSGQLRRFRSALKMKLFGFQQIKVKVGAADIREDMAVLSQLRRLCGRQVDLRLDANEAWNPEDVVPRMQALAEFHPSSLEQPVPHASVSALAQLRTRLTVPVMLDESLCCYQDGVRAIADQTCDLFNLRISKCGGLLNCLRLARLAEQHSIGWQVGCMVGETGILSAAGRHLACSLREMRYLEGSYDRFLLRDRKLVTDVTFGYGGHARPLTGSGLGVAVNESRVRQLARRTVDLI